MGNYGNTIDRWYHRAAVIVWPARLRFVNRARIDMAWALDDLHARLDDGQAEAAPPTWRPCCRSGAWRVRPRAGGLVETALLVAARLDDDPTLAAAFSTRCRSSSRPPPRRRAARTRRDPWR